MTIFWVLDRTDSKSQLGFSVRLSSSARRKCELLIGLKRMISTEIPILFDVANATWPSTPVWASASGGRILDEID